MTTTLIDVSLYQGDEKPKPIIIENNSSLSFTVASCTINDRPVYKAVFDFSDDEVQEISQPIQAKVNTIEGLEPPDWRIIEHEFNFKERYEYAVDVLDENLPCIKVTLYTFVGDSQVIKIPFKVFYKTLYDLGRVFKVESANLTNQCTVSYVLSSGDSEMIIVQSNDWRRMYGENDYTLVSNPVQTVEAPANYYVDDDSSVWHWKTKPEMKWINEPEKIDDSHVTFSWTEGDVPLDKVVLKYKLIDEEEWTEIDITDTEIVDGYKTYTIDKDFSNNVLQVCFVLDGGNSITNTTDPLYFRGSNFTKGQMTFNGAIEELDTEVLIKVKPLDDVRYLNLEALVIIVDQYQLEGEDKTTEYVVEVDKDSGEGELHLRKVFISDGNHVFTLRFKQLGNDERIGSETQTLADFSYESSIDFTDGYKPKVQDNQIVCKFKILPETPYFINLKYVINEENATIYTATLELKKENEQYFYYGTIDGTLIPSESGETHQINVWIEGMLGDPLTCPHNGREFRFGDEGDPPCYVVDFSYPATGSELKIQRFCDFEQSGVNQYAFETMTSMFVDPRDDNSKELRIRYLDGTVTRTQSMEKTNRFDLYNDAVEAATLIGYDRRDTLYKRETQKEYDLTAVDFPDIQAFSSLNYLNDPLKYTIGVGYTYVDKGGETKSCKYNDIKNYSLFKVPSTHKLTVDDNIIYCNYSSSHAITTFDAVTYTEDRQTDPKSYTRYKLNQEYQSINAESLQQLPDSEASFDFETSYNGDDYSYQIDVVSTHDVGNIVSENSAVLYNGNQQIGLVDFERDELKSFRNLASGDYELHFCFNSLDTYGETSERRFVSLFEEASINFSINNTTLTVKSTFETPTTTEYKHHVTLVRPDGSSETKNFSNSGQASFTNVVPGDYELRFLYERNATVSNRASRTVKFTI